MRGDSYSEVRSFIRKFDLVESDTGQVPVSEEELSMLKLQLEVAKFIASEISESCQQGSELSKSQMLNSFIKVWSVNIKNFTKLLLRTP